MEDSLGLQKKAVTTTAVNVLILVVMEDSLGHVPQIQQWRYLRTVLILVVMEDSLGHLQACEDYATFMS